MALPGRMSTKTPTMKRILKEAAELSQSPSTDYHAEPLETNLFEWHFTLRGPPAPSSFAGGIYHGRISLPMTYPLRPPSFRFLTPSGRFEVNREICLSISGHHEETWQPAWGIRTALVAIRSFMDTDVKGQVGGVQGTDQARKEMAKASVDWCCAGCAKSNRKIMQEREEAVKAMDGESQQGKGQEEVVPEELKLGYRDELGAGAKAEKQDVSPVVGKPATPAAPAVGSPTVAVTTTSSATHAARAMSSQQQRRRSQRSQVDGLLDNAILGLSILFTILILRRILTFLLS